MTLNCVRFAPALLFVAIVSAAPLRSSQPSTPLTAVVLPNGPYSQVAIRVMGREAAHILKQSGVSLRWQIGTPAQAVSGFLVVVRLLGHCDMDGSPAFLEPGPLGWAHEADGTILPFSDLACDNLRGAAEAAIADGSPIRGNVLLGRAMGRVLAHELYHIVADTAEHGRVGVAQEALSPQELTVSPLELGQRETAAIKSGLTRAR